jgi:hypothetical protein
MPTRHSGARRLQSRRDPYGRQVTIGERDAERLVAGAGYHLPLIEEQLAILTLGLDPTSALVRTECPYPKTDA